VGELLRAGADANVRNNKGVSPLIAAAWNGAAAVCQLLVEAGAEPNGTDPDRTTALMFASRQGKPHCISKLLKLGCDMRPNCFGLDPLMFAAMGGDADTVQVVLVVVCGERGVCGSEWRGERVMCGSEWRVGANGVLERVACGSEWRVGARGVWERGVCGSGMGASELGANWERANWERANWERANWERANSERANWE
jgi:hypothetical protein